VDEEVSALCGRRRRALRGPQGREARDCRRYRFLSDLRHGRVTVRLILRSSYAEAALGRGLWRPHAVWARLRVPARVLERPTGRLFGPYVVRRPVRLMLGLLDAARAMLFRRFFALVCDVMFFRRGTAHAILMGAKGGRYDRVPPARHEGEGEDDTVQLLKQGDLASSYYRPTAVSSRLECR
jgi:hypothetical protein